jgi:dipeptidyl aminopeptidase/acylaminoacyl peptidase
VVLVNSGLPDAPGMLNAMRHGVIDVVTTPIGDGEKWFMALKKRGVPTELVRYPRSSHGLSRTGEPWLLVDRLERIRSWFTHWLIERAGS